MFVMASARHERVKAAQKGMSTSLISHIIAGSSCNGAASRQSMQLTKSNLGRHMWRRLAHADSETRLALGVLEGTS